MSPVHYYQRPDAGYLLMDTTVNIVTGHGGKIEVGRGGNGRLRFMDPSDVPRVLNSTMLDFLKCRIFWIKNHGWDMTLLILTNYS